MELLAPFTFYVVIVGIISNFSNILLTYQFAKLRREKTHSRKFVKVAKVEQGLIASIICTSFLLSILIIVIATSLFKVYSLAPSLSIFISLYTGSQFWLTVLFVPSVRRFIIPNLQIMRRLQVQSITQTSSRVVE
ncbi:hypothetical protein PRIPAC_83854 [Pristionchus pacificus]|nr:hypothetical protein PRIPAC_83854 [Pristionchus pacificus]